MTSICRNFVPLTVRNLSFVRLVGTSSREIRSTESMSTSVSGDQTEIPWINVAFLYRAQNLIWNHCICLLVTMEIFTVATFNLGSYWTPTGYPPSIIRAFVGISKETWLPAYMAPDDNNPTIDCFRELGKGPIPAQLTDGDLPPQVQHLEKFVCQVYFKVGLTTFQELRCELFRSRNVEGERCCLQLAYIY